MNESSVLIPIAALIPFAFMLLSIALGPVVAGHWWEKNKSKLIVSLVLGIPTAIYLISVGMTHELADEFLFDYIPFVILLLSLYVITGGIHLSGTIKASSRVNTIFLAIGFTLASFMGTTGAAMLLIRPLITTNKKRKYKTHTLLFFIALVANCGGLITPLGDPPLFMLYMRGAPFSWFSSMLPEWLFTGIVLLTIYYLLDRFYYSKKENHEVFVEECSERKPLHLGGRINLLYLIGVVLAVAFINPTYIPAMKVGKSFFLLEFLREFALVAFTLLSLWSTKRKVRYELNQFTWAPIIEIAVLFLGIFITMSPALIYLSQHASNLGVNTTTQFYYATGFLSSFLDNTPTAMAFHGLSCGLPISLEAAQAGIVDGTFKGVSFIAGVPENLLKAISTSAVFFGSLTYIGNGPNFMVKAIAEENHIKMPSFFGYMFTFSLLILLPLFVVLQLLFL